MQLLNSVETRLLDTLQDIVSNVQIKSDFCISHPNYKPLELPTEAVIRFQQLPLDLQNKYFSLQLRSFLYSIYYNGELKAISNQDSGVPQQLENNTVMGLNIEFYDRLHESNSGEGYFDPGWCVIRQESDGSLAVQKNNLTLHIERDRHLQTSEQSATIDDSVAVWTPRNRVEEGCYLAIGNAGLVNYSSSNHNSEIVDIYFNFSPEGAVAVMQNLTRQLNQTKIPFTFKVLYNPADYGRYDSGILYFERSNYQAVHKIMQIVYAENKLHFKREVPLFTKLLAPGLALAEEPNCKFTVQENFGMSRCQIVANGLLEAWHKSDESPDARIKSIVQQFALVGIELKCPYLNPNSEDIYLRLDYKQKTATGTTNRNKH